MRAQPLPNRSLPKASGADSRSQSSQRLGNRSVASIVKTFLAVVVCGLLLGFGLAYLPQDAPIPAPSAGANASMQALPVATALEDAADEEELPVSSLPVPAAERPLAKPVQSASTAAWQAKVRRARAARRASRPAARTRIGTWLRQTREKLLPRRRESNEAQRRKKKASPCRCAFNLGAPLEVVKA
jgi:hypothetical protein